MLTVEQIKLLESRVLKAVEKITSLQDENSRLRDGLAKYERRIEELEVLMNEFRDGQQAIEDGILSALKRLDVLEDEISVDEEPVPPQPEPVQAAPAAPEEAEQTEADAPKPEVPEAEATSSEPDEDAETESETELDIF